MCIPYFVYSSMNRYFSCFYLWLLWIMLWTCMYKYLFKSLLSILLGRHPGVELLDCMVILCLIFWENIIPFFHSGVPFYIPTTNQKSSNFSTSSPARVFCCFDNSHSNVIWYLTAVLICVAQWVLMPSIFSCACWLLVYLLCRDVTPIVLSPFLNKIIWWWLLNYRILYIFFSLILYGCDLQSYIISNVFSHCMENAYSWLKLDRVFVGNHHKHGSY